MPLLSARPYRPRFGLREWLLAPVLHRLEEMLNPMTLDIAQLQAAVTRNGSVIAQSVVLVGDLRGRIAALNDKLETAAADQIDDATREQLRSLVASLDASTDAAASVLADPVADPAIPTGDVAQPPASNPATPDPMSVPGAVEPVEALPAELDPNGHTQPTDGSLEDAAASAEQQAPEVVATPDEASQPGVSDADR